MTVSLRALCTEKVGLPEADIVRLERIAENLQLMAELTGSDVFVDCLLPDNSAIVVAEAKPVSGQSVYVQPVVGMIALPVDEPAVFNAFVSGMPVRDLKAITQEKRSVRQDVVPVRGSGGTVIAVLIREKDISQSIQQDKKYKELARERESFNDSLLTSRSEDASAEREIAMLEIHHRVKNNLQLVSSILNMQARKSNDPEVKRILLENVNRVLSISTIHDILCTTNCDGMKVNSRVLLQKLWRNFHSFAPEGSIITFHIVGDDLELGADKATSIALVVSELLTNAMIHAFAGRKKGAITVVTTTGNLYNTVSIGDDGVGFDYAARTTTSLGLNIVAATVQDKLKGKLVFKSDTTGTKVVFDYKN